MKKRIREKIEAVTGEPEPPSLEGSQIGFQNSGMPPEGTPEREAMEAEKQDRKDRQQVVYFTFEQVQRMMQDIVRTTGEQSKTALIEAIKEMKRPSEEEAKKLSDEKQRRAELIDALVKAARDEERLVAQRQSSCSHRKADGVMNYGGQVHGDRVKLICKMCQKMLVDRPASSDDYQQGPLEMLIENQRIGLVQ